MTRRHELDWLRVLLFALLIPHHVAVGFVDWGVDIYKFVNDRLAGDGLTLFIYWSHSWRLPSLFMIAGLGTWFLTAGGIGIRVMGPRLLSLLAPLIFATAFINVFGGYAIATMTGTATGLISFWWDWLTEPEPRQVQHLWFLINLTLYTVILWPIFALRDQIARAVPKPPLLLAVLVIASAASVVLLKPYAAALTGDNYQFVLYLIFFLGGYLIGADHVRVLDWAKRQAWWLLALAIILFVIKATLLTLALINDLDTGQALAEGGWIARGLSPQNATVFSIVEAATAWFWCVAAMGLASRFLNRPGRLLPALNRAVFPLYVLHFPLTLVGLALAAQFSAPWWIEFFVLLIFVYTGSWILWRIFDNIGPAAFLVGGKPAKNAYDKLS
jgi:glucan biosynthesis protein C